MRKGDCCHNGDVCNFDVKNVPRAAISILNMKDRNGNGTVVDPKKGEQFLETMSFFWPDELLSTAESHIGQPFLCEQVD